MSSFSDRIDEAKRLRMVRGEEKHGPLNLEADSRDFVDEAIEELIDCLNYLEIAMLQGKIPFCKWYSIDQTLRFMIFRVVEEKGKGVGHGDGFNASYDMQQGGTGLLNGNSG